jgi:DNA-binding NarL/FixJ family response regulator
MKKKIKIIIVDDQALMRDGLTSILALKEDIDVIGTASDGKEAFEKAKNLQPHIVLMDIRMPGINGVQGTKLIRAELPHIKVLMLTTFKDSELIIEALEEGASGYLLKDMPTEAIVQAIKTVHSGGIVLPEELTAQIFLEMKKVNEINKYESREYDSKNLPTLSQDLLTDREWIVLEKLGKGLNNKEISQTLFITEGTVKNHVSNIINKLDIRDRTQAAIFAVRHGITRFNS